MSDSYFHKFKSTLHNTYDQLQESQVDQVLSNLRNLRDRKGRLFIIGVGGGAGHSSHAVNDFRKLCGIDAVSPLDNVSELTARINDDGWDSSIVESLRVSGLSRNDALFVFSVGGGSETPPISSNLVAAIKLALEVDADIFGVVGNPNGFAAKNSSNVIVLESSVPGMRTPIVEGLQSVVWHLLVSHPILRIQPGKWEQLEQR